MMYIAVMKRMFLFTTAVLLLSACKEKKGWNAGDQIIFMDQCVQTASAQFRDSLLSRTYCSCMLVKLKENFPDLPTAQDQMTMKQANAFAVECLPEGDTLNKPSSPPSF
jgi:hypothetical protein